jgi:hypothetical protein
MSSFSQKYCTEKPAVRLFITVNDTFVRCYANKNTNRTELSSQLKEANKIDNVLTLSCKESGKHEKFNTRELASKLHQRTF